MRAFLKKLLPSASWKYVRGLGLSLRVDRLLNFFHFMTHFFSDFRIFWRYNLVSTKLDSYYGARAVLIKQTHVIEKGLSMPEARLGFGIKIVRALIKNIAFYTAAYGVDDTMEAAYETLCAYFEFNKELNSTDPEFLIAVSDFSKLIKSNKQNNNSSGVIKYSHLELKHSAGSTFEEFVYGRHSVRNFTSEPVPIAVVRKAVGLSLKTPSNCNTQPWRVHYYSDKNKCKELLALQNGNRGFGHTVSNLLIITSRLDGYAGVEQRHLPFIDGGMYALGLTYALHHEGLGTCCLNLALNQKTENKLREAMNISKSEVFIMMIAFGKVPDAFLVAKSHRNPIDEILDARC